MPPELSWSRNLQIELLVTKLKYKMQAKMLLRTSQWIPWCHLYSCITLFNSLNPLHSELISSKWALVLITCTYSNQSNKNYSNKLKVVCTKSKTLLVILLFCNLCLMIMLLTLSQVSLFQSIKCSVVENFWKVTKKQLLSWTCLPPHLSELCSLNSLKNMVKTKSLI